MIHAEQTVAERQTAATPLLYRTNHASVVHWHLCALINGGVIAVPWDWARGRDADQVAHALRRNGLEACTLCNPIEKLRTVQR